MPGEEVAIVAIVFGSILAVVFMGILGSVIKAAIKRKSGDITQNKEFLAALREFKEKTDRRLSNLEAVVTDENKPKSSAKQGSLKKEDSSKSIEIELQDEDSSEKESSGKLRNMLNQ